MSSFGDNNIKTTIQEEFDCWFNEIYGHYPYEATDSEKNEFLFEMIDILKYCLGKYFDEDKIGNWLRSK